MKKIIKRLLIGLFALIVVVILAAHFFLDRHLSCGPRMKMKVVRCGSTAFRSVVEDRPAGTKISHELEECSNMFINGLKAMIYM